MIRAQSDGSRPPSRLRFGVDTGGTFTDLIVDGLEEGIRIFKRPTTPEDPLTGIVAVFDAGARALGISMTEFLGRGDQLIFGTTRATNAIVERNTATVALLVTEGHPDTLVLREGADRRGTMFDWSWEYYHPYVPRSLTFEVPERIGAQGEVIAPLDEERAERLLEEVAASGVEAIAVCLLWSIVNSAHEVRVGELIERHLPDTPFTLSHALNPSIREYRRASSTAIDASLKPLMSRFYGELADRLEAAGFSGRLLAMTSSGGVLDAELVRQKPIHSIGSGPAAAPVAGRHFAGLDAGRDTAIVTDAGGTTFDVSVIRRSEIPWSRETVVGSGRHKAITGLPSVDAASIGAGGGSIASVDSGGLLHVGPASAGASPGPACYAAGGTEPTVTDACVVLGYIDPDNFLGGAMTLDVGIAERTIAERVAEPLGVDLEGAARAIFDLATEHMVDAIEQIALVQGIDPSDAAVVAGGGGGGLYATAIGTRLGSPVIVIPEVSAGLSAAGMVLSDVQATFTRTGVWRSDESDLSIANDALAGLTESARAFVADSGYPLEAAELAYFVEARYPNQVWEIDVPLPVPHLGGEDDIASLHAAFHRTHDEIFAFSDRESPIEAIAWRCHARVALPRPRFSATPPSRARDARRDRTAALRGEQRQPTRVLDLPELELGREVAGPVLVEASLATVVVDSAWSLERCPSGSILLTPRLEA